MLPLTFADADDYDALEAGDVLVLADLQRVLREGGGELTARNTTQERELALRHTLSPRQVELLLAGGLINWMRTRLDD